MDTGPQKESDTPQEAGRQRRKRQREKERERGGKRAKGKKRHFKARPKRQVGNDSNTGRKKKTANMLNCCSQSLGSNLSCRKIK